MNVTIILCKTVVNVFSVVLHITLLLTIACTPSLKCGGFDELFFSQNMGDVVAVVLRVITKYSPVLILRNHSGLIQLDKETVPLATLTNAAEWYSNYVIILSALAFGLDRAVMAVSIRSYSWADSTYDAIDMLFETLFYAPVLCMLNAFTTIMLYSQWNTVRKRIERRLRKASDRVSLPSVSELFSVCIEPEVGGCIPPSLTRYKDRKERRLLHRLELELSFAMIAVIDQQIDFFAVLFYTLYWASYSHYIDVDATKFLEVYSYIFEVGNIIPPYILLCFFPDLRKEFFRRFKPRCHSSEHDLHD